MSIRKLCAIMLGAFMIVSGSYCLFTPAGTGLNIGYIIGLSMIFDGVGRIIQWFTVRKEMREGVWALIAAIISLALGIVLSISAFVQLAVDLYFAYMTAFWLIALGVLRVVRSLKVRGIRKSVRKNYDRNTEFGKSWWIYLLFGVLLAGYGVVCAIYPIVSLAAIGTFIGIGIIVAGANLILLGSAPVDL